MMPDNVQSFHFQFVISMPLHFGVFNGSVNISLFFFFVVVVVRFLFSCSKHTTTMLMCLQGVAVQLQGVLLGRWDLIAYCLK